jgi:hypothetical protein
MLLILRVCTGRTGAAPRKYVVRYPGRRHADANVHGLEQRLR